MNGWPTAMTVFEARHAAQGGTKAAGQPNNQGKKASTAGLRPDGRTKRGTCRAWLIDGRGKAWSKRPDRQAGRHGRKRPPLRGAKTGTNHARPTSRPPAQPGACARHAGKVRGDRKTENRFIRKKVGQHRALNGLQQRAEVARHAFEGQGTPKGREAEKTALRAFGEVCRI